MTRDPTPSEERGHLAAEHALGVLEGEELLRARALERDDPEFRAEVARWTGRLAPMLDEIAPVVPPAAMFASIEQRIAEGAPGASNVIQLRRKLTRWRALAGGATAIAASLALVLLVRPPAETLPPTASEPMVAMIDGEQGTARLVATWDADSRRLMVVPAVVPAADPDHAHELWVIPADGKPRSMGVMPASGPMHATVAGEMAAQLDEGVTLAVSVEPAGGSPSGLPTGPVIASGKFRKA